MDINMISETEKEILISKYGKLNIEKEEHPNSKFYVGVLDRFNKPLSIEEADNLFISFDPTNKETQSEFFEQEDKFLKFFKVAYKINGEKSVYVYCPEFFTLKRKAYSTIINTFFNDRDKQLLKMFLKNNNYKNGIFTVENECTKTICEIIYKRGMLLKLLF